MTDADALSHVQEFLTAAPNGEVPYAAIARVWTLATSSVATMQRNVELESQIERMRDTMIQKELR
jgi:hypothetical protein